MDINTILSGLRHSNYNARYSAISSLRSSFKNNNGTLNPSTLNKIFCSLSNLLLDDNWSVTQATILLLGELSAQIIDLSVYAPMVLPNLICNLGNIKGVIRRSTLSTLVIFVKQLHSAQAVISTLISVGFVHSDTRVRQGSILVIPQIVGPNTNGINLQILLKALIFRLLDKSPNVVMSTQQSIAYLSKIRKEEFVRIQNALDHESFTVLTQHHHDIHNALLQQFQDSISYQEIQRFANINFKGLMIANTELISKLLHCTRRHEWKNALCFAQNILSSIKQFCSKQRHHHLRKNNNLKHFLLFICRFLEIQSPQISNDETNNYQISDLQLHSRCDFVNIFLQMLECLIAFDENGMMQYAHYFIPRLIELMSNKNSNTLLYEKCTKITQKLHQQSSASNYLFLLQSFADVLQQSNDNVRECIIENILCLLLNHGHIRGEQLQCVDFQIITNNLCKCMNQSECDSNLHHLIIECLAVLHHRLGLTLLTLLQNSTINGNDMQNLRERFKSKSLPILSKDGKIQMTKMNKQKRQRVNDQKLFVDSMGYSQMAQIANAYKSKQHNKPTKNAMASRKIPFLSNYNHANNNEETNLLQRRIANKSMCIKAPMMNNNLSNTNLPKRTHSAPVQHHHYQKIAGHLSLLKKRKSRASSAHSANITQLQQLQQSSLANKNRAKSFSNLHSISVPSSVSLSNKSAFGATIDVMELDEILEHDQSDPMQQQQQSHQHRYTKNRTNNRKISITQRQYHSSSSAPVRISASSQSQSQSQRRSVSANNAMNAPALIASAESSQYILSSQLTACDNPERASKCVLKKLQSKQWDERFVALNTIRKMAYFHKHLLLENASLLSDICRFIGIEINSLRSSLSRTALIAVSDLFICFDRKLESNKIIDCLLPNIMRRAGEMSNEFISAAADKAVYAMIDNISQSKALNILLSHSKSKSPPIRSKVAMYLLRAVVVSGVHIFAFRDYQRLIKVVGAYLNESAVNTRNYAKRIIVRLSELNKDCQSTSKDEFDRKLKNLLTLQQYTKVQSVLARSHQIISDYHHDASSPKIKRIKSNKYRLSASSQISETNALSVSGITNLESARINLSGCDWKQRIKGLKQLTELMEATNIESIATLISDKLSDSNAKVAKCAVNQLQNLVCSQTEFKICNASLSKICLIFLQPLCKNIAAANPSIRKNSEDALNQIVIAAPVPTQIVANISQIIRFSNSRIKSQCLPKLNDAVFRMKMMKNNQNENEAVILNSVIPAIYSLINVSKAPNFQSDFKKLVRISHSIVGHDAFFNCKIMKNQMRKDQIYKIAKMLQR